MHRWGAWGFYDGTCTPGSCTYTIELNSLSFRNRQRLSYAWLVLASPARPLQPLRLARRSRRGVSGLFARFATAPSWRESSAIGVDVPRRQIRRENDFDKSLSLGAVSRQRLHKTLKDWQSFMGDDSQLAQHPFYRVGRPSGCMLNCEIGVVYFSTHMPPAEIERLTSYDFSCFTRLHPCTELEDLPPRRQRVAPLTHPKKIRNRARSPRSPAISPSWALGARRPPTSWSFKPALGKDGAGQRLPPRGREGPRPQLTQGARTLAARRDRERRSLRLGSKWCAARRAPNTYLPDGSTSSSLSATTGEIRSSQRTLPSSPTAAACTKTLPSYAASSKEVSPRTITSSPSATPVSPPSPPPRAPQYPA